MNKISEALLFARKAHKGQKYGDKPYYYHIKNVVDLCITMNYSEEIIIAAALHDVLEDTKIGYQEIKNKFGEEVAEIVYCVTDELGRNRKERKLKTYPKIRENWKATVVKICDRISNIEHSKLTDKKKLNMYLSEQYDFFLNLKNSKHPSQVDELWFKLDKIVEEYE